MEYIVDGHPGPYYLHVEDIPGGDKYWHSHDATGAGALTFPEIPYGLRVLGDGVIPGYEEELEVSVTGSSTLSMASGACNVAGHIVVNYVVDNLTVSRPASITRLDRLVCRLYPDTASVTPGKAEFGLLAGNTDGTAVDLTQTSEVYEIGLGVVTVPVAAPISFSDSRSFSGLGAQPVTGVARDGSVTTTSVGGEALSGLSVSLDLTRNTTYDIEAALTAIQDNDTTVAGGWTLVATYGSTGSGNNNYDTPSQVALNSSGEPFVLDMGNGRIVHRDTAGVYQAQDSTPSGTRPGLAIDSSNALYFCDASAGGIRKQTALSVAATWDSTVGVGTSAKHLATDATNVFVCDASSLDIEIYACSDGTNSSFSYSGGSGNGQFGATGPYGICHDGTYLYITDPTNSRVQRFLKTTGAYDAQFAVTGTPRGIAYDSLNSHILVARNASDLVSRYDTSGSLVDSVAINAPHGVAVHTDGTVWVTSDVDDTLTKYTWAVASGATGYGQVAVAIDGNVGTYLGIGDEVGMVGNSHTYSVQGPASVDVAAYGKRTSGTMTLESAVLSAKAVPRR